ncbi:Bud-site selection protein [Aspergillus falconensis]
MPKRKLSDLTDMNDTTHPQKPKLSEKEYQHLKLQTARLKQKFEFGVTSLSRALKTARGFERQKLGRRQKVAKGGPGAEIAVAHAKKAKSKPKSNVNPEEILRRIEGEIQVLKSLDPTTTAEKYLFKQLAKTKRIAESPVFYRFKQSKEKKIKLEGPKSTEEANVTARLFKSNPAQNVLPGIMEGLRGLFGLEGTGTKGKKSKEENEGGNGETGEKVGDGEDVSGVEFVSESESEDEAGARVARGADGDVDMEDAVSDDDEEDYSHFDARLASDSEDANDENDDDDLSDDDNDNARSSQPRRSSMSISLSPSQSPPPKKPKSTSASKTPATSTTFLPSLMMGGYWSGSESEPEELEEAPKRKNRMGQQARRALWEKKYGAAANHIKAEQQKGKNGKGKGGRDAGWDLRKGATGDGDRDRGRKKFGTGSNAMAMSGKDRFGAGAGAGAAKEGPAVGGRSKKAKPQDDKPLHPSWEAARKAKEQKAMASFQGKKVVFD